MSINQADILNALKTVKYPGYSRDIVSFGLVKDIHAHDGHVAVTLELTTADEKISAALKPAVVEALKPFENLAQIDVHLNVVEPAAKKTAVAKELPGVKHVIAIASGKGGVGKTTVAVNLAYALKKVLEEKVKKEDDENARLAGSLRQERGSRATALVGLMDCDIYGPTVPLMLGANGDPEVMDGKLMPFEAHGLKVMSMGLLIDENAPVVWRGPMITKAIHQFISDVNWGELDYLIVDLPPGTGDAQLTLAQGLKMDGAIIVTTPQVAASQVAVRGAQMFAKVGVPIIGVIENMSYLMNEKGEKSYIFGAGGGESTALALNAPLLAQLPVDPTLRENADAGRPILAVENTEKNISAEMYRKLAEQLI